MFIGALEKDGGDVINLHPGIAQRSNTKTANGGGLWQAIVD